MRRSPPATGEEALDRAAVKPPAAAILDLMLPDIDGVEVTKRLREWSEMPIIVLSAVGEEEAKVRALAAGADDYVTKPFGPPELVARLEAVLRRAKPEASEPLIAADGLEIDLVARAVRRDGEEVHLTPTEFELLRTLAQNRGRLMTHRSLLVEVWGVGVRRRRPGAARPRRQPAPQDRARRRAPLHPHRPRRRLPLRGLEATFTKSVYGGRVPSCGLDGVRRTIAVWISSRSPWRVAAFGLIYALIGALDRV